MVSGIREAQKTLEAYKALPATQIPKEDRFRQMVEVGLFCEDSLRALTSVIDAPKQIFLQRAVPAVETLSRQAKKVEAEANSLVLFFGESPQETKPESVFDTIAQFLADLRVRFAFVCLSMSLIMVRITQRADAESQAIEAAAAAKSSQAAVGAEGAKDRPSNNAPPPAVERSDSKVRRRTRWRVPPQTSLPSLSLCTGGTTGTESRSLSACARPGTARRSIARPAERDSSPRSVCRGAPALAHLPVLLIRRSLAVE